MYSSRLLAPLPIALAGEVLYNDKLGRRSLGWHPEQADRRAHSEHQHHEGMAQGIRLQPERE